MCYTQACGKSSNELLKMWPPQRTLLLISVFSCVSYLVCGRPKFVPTPTRGRLWTTFLTVAVSGKLNMTATVERQKENHKICMYINQGYNKTMTWLHIGSYCVLSHFCWPWRFPQQYSAACTVWRRWLGSLRTAIFHEDLLYRLESGRQNRKRNTNGKGVEFKKDNEDGKS